MSLISCLTKVTAIFRDGTTEYVRIVVTNCCVTERLLEVRANGYYDLVACEMLSKAASVSIKNAIETYYER